MSDDAEKRGISLAAAFLQLQLAGDSEGQSTLLDDALSSGRVRELIGGLSGFALTFGRQAFGEDSLPTVLRQMVFDFQPDADQ